MTSIKKTLVVNSTVRNYNYAGFVRTSTPMFSGNGLVLVPFKIGNKLIGYTKWVR